MNEEWVRWEPLPAIQGTYVVTRLHNDSDILEITLSDTQEQNRRLLVDVKWLAATYKVTHDFSLVLKKLDAMYGKAFYEGWAFFKRTNSMYARFLSEQSGTLSDSYHLQHVSVLGNNALIDMLVYAEPIVTPVVWDAATITHLYKDCITPYIYLYFPHARITLYEVAVRNNAPDKPYIKLALSMNTAIDPIRIQRLLKDIVYAAVPVECIIVDESQLAPEVKQKIAQEGIIWEGDYE